VARAERLSRAAAAQRVPETSSSPTATEWFELGGFRNPKSETVQDRQDCALTVEETECTRSRFSG